MVLTAILTVISDPPTAVDASPVTYNQVLRTGGTGRDDCQSRRGAHPLDLPRVA